MNIGDLWSWMMGPQTWIGTRFWIIAALIAVPVFIVREYRAGKRRDAIARGDLSMYQNLVSHDDEEDDD